MSNIKIIRPFSREPISKNSLEGFLYSNGYTKIPGTVEMVTPLTDAKGNAITGIDENSMRIRAIADPETKAAEIERVKALREKLEAEINEDLTPSSPFWKDANNGKCNKLYMLKDGDNYFDLDDPYQAIDYYWITQLPIVAKSIEDVHRGKIDPTTVKFYVFQADVETQNEFNRKKRVNEVVAILNKLGDVEIRKVAFVLNLKPGEKADYQKVYNILDNFLRSPKTYGTSDPIDEFLKVTNYSPEMLAAKTLVKQLLEDRIIKERGNSIYEGESLVAKSMEDFELKLMEDADYFKMYEDKSRNRKLYLNNI